MNLNNLLAVLECSRQVWVEQYEEWEIEYLQDFHNVKITQYYAGSKKLTLEMPTGKKIVGIIVYTEDFSLEELC